MSLNIRYLTNGTITVYTVRNNGVDPPIFEIYYNLEDIDITIRHYAPVREPVHCEPYLARIFGVLDLFYPDNPICPLKEYTKHINEPCIGDSCRYRAGSGDPDEGFCPLIGTPQEYKPGKYIKKAGDA